MGPLEGEGGGGEIAGRDGPMGGRMTQERDALGSNLALFSQLIAGSMT